MLKLTDTQLAVDIDDEAVATPKQIGGRTVPAHKVKAPATRTVTTHKRSSVAAREPAGKKHQPGKAKAKAGSKPARGGAGDPTSDKADPGSKQSHLIGMLQSPAGATIAAMMKATGWQPHSVRGFLAGVVRKRLKLTLGSKKVDGVRLYQIAQDKGADRRRSRHRSS